MSVETNKSLVRRFYNVVWNTWDEQATREILSPEIDFRGSIGLQKHGQDGFIEYLNIMQSAFPDFHNQIDDLVAEQISGFIAIKTFPPLTGERVSIVGFETMEAPQEWREHPEPREAHRLGRERFYSEFRAQVLENKGSYSFKAE